MEIGVREEAIVEWIGVMPIVIAILGAGMFMLLAKNTFLENKGKLVRNLEDFMEHLAGRGKESNWYIKCDKWLRRNGAGYHLGKGITPASFWGMRFLLGITGFFVVEHFGILYGCCFAVFLFVLPWLLVCYCNYQDNQRLITDLKLLYHGLEIQIRAGVYITNALAECYSCVEHPRLKHALLDLAGDVVVHGDLYQALNRLQEQFDNRYVDSLCIIILQAMESGQAVDLLSDLSEQIKDMELAVLTGKKESLDRSITFYQLGILSAVMGVILYACVMQMVSAASFM